MIVEFSRLLVFNFFFYFMQIWSYNRWILSSRDSLFVFAIFGEWHLVNGTVRKDLRMSLLRTRMRMYLKLGVSPLLSLVLPVILPRKRLSRRSLTFMGRFILNFCYPFVCVMNAIYFVYNWCLFYISNMKFFIIKMITQCLLHVLKKKIGKIAFH